MNRELRNIKDEKAAAMCKDEMVEFLQKLGIAKRLSDCGMPQEDIEVLAKQCMVLPDFKANPRVATYEEMIELVTKSW